jgi:trimethylamine--corrinoid protein Co-methyltransferase
MLNIPHLSLLSKASCEEIHLRTLDVLWRTGVKYSSPKALAVLRDAGAKVDDEALIAHLPPHLVEETLKLAPKECVLAGRDPAADAHLGRGENHVSLDGSGATMLDFRSGRKRPSTGQDLAEAVRIGDYLPEVGVMWGAVSANDAPPNVQVLTELSIELRNTGKHIQAEAQRPEEVPFIVDLLRAASDDGEWRAERPIFSIVYCPVSPLQHEREMCEAAMLLAPLKVPMAVYSLALCGATAPVTLAGGILQTNAEILSALVLFQLVQAGTPIIYVADCGILDMRAGIYVCAGPEAMLMNVGLTEMARFYGLPVAGTGFSSDAKELTMLTGLDGGMSALATMLAGVDLLYGIGMLDAAQLLYLPKMVLDAEVVRICRRVLAGVAVDEEHLLTGLIGEVGPGGHFLKAKETRRFLHEGEHFQPQMFLRGIDGGEVCSAAHDVERATAEVERILTTHQPKPLPPGGEERFAEIIAAAAGELTER